MTDDPMSVTVTLRGVIFSDDDEVLVLRRASDGGWELPGGRLGPDEDPCDALCREVEEETGLPTTVERPVHSISWRNDEGQGRFAVYYRCRSDGRAVSVSDEHVAADWVSPTTAADRLSAPQWTAVSRARSRGW